MSEWRRLREALRSWEEAWSAEFAERGHRATIEVEPGVEPPATAQWHWWITFRSAGTELDAIAAPAGTTLAFEDERGVFEEEVTLGGVVDHVIGKWAEVTRDRSRS